MAHVLSPGFEPGLPEHKQPAPRMLTAIVRRIDIRIDHQTSNVFGLGHVRDILRQGDA